MSRATHEGVKDADPDIRYFNLKFNLNFLRRVFKKYQEFEFKYFSDVFLESVRGHTCHVGVKGCRSGYCSFPLRTLNS